MALALRSGAAAPRAATLRFVRSIFPDVHAAGKNDFSSFRRRRKPGRGLPFLDFSPEDEGRKSPVGCLPLSGCPQSGSPRSGVAGGGAAAATGRGKVVSFCGKGMPSSAGSGGGGMGARPINGYIWVFLFHYLSFSVGKAK